MSRLYLWGYGEIARTAKAYFKYYPVDQLEFDEYVHVVDDEYIKFKRLPKSPIRYMETSCGTLSAGNLISFSEFKASKESWKYLFLPVSYRDCNQLRESIFNKCYELPGITFMSHHHPVASIVPDVVFNGPSWIQEHCNIQSAAKIGKNVIVWSGGHVGHNSIIGDHSWITTGTVICSSVVLENNVFCGANSVISPEVRVGHHSIVGSGAIITKDLEPYSIAIEGRNNIISKKSFELKMS